MADYRQIMALLIQGRSYREIAGQAGSSHREISTAKAVMTTREITSERLAAMSDAELQGLFPDGRSRVSDEYEQPAFGKVVQSFRHNRHYTLLQAWRTYTGSSTPLRKYGYAQYCHLFSEYAARNDLVAVLHHEPGRAVFVDWAGDTVPLVDSVTGENTKAYLFVAVLPFSGLVFSIASTDMRMGAWLHAHVAAFEYFGGVPQILVPDNALTAMHRKTKGEAARFVTDRYRQMAGHYNLAIVPARVRKPRDKAAVESGVNVINKRVLGYLNEETWTSIAELNEAILERVHEINHETRGIDGSTRNELFTAEEQPLLSPLPADGFEEVEWRESKVARNYHITCDSQHYSVPHEYAGQLLRVRLTSSKVTIFDGQHIVAEHARSSGRKVQYATDPAHVPEQHRNVAGLWSREWFLDRARGFGPATVEVIGRVLDPRDIEAQGYLDCQNILETLGTRDKQRLEAACQQLINIDGYPSYSTLKRLITGINSDAQKQRPLRPAASNKKPVRFEEALPPDVFVRGADYYREVR